MKNEKIEVNFIDGNEKFFMAAIKGEIEILKKYLKNFLPDQLRNKDGETLLHIAIKANNISSVKFLIENKADPESRVEESDLNGLGIALQYTTSEMVGFLLQVSSAKIAQYRYLARNNSKESLVIFNKFLTKQIDNLEELLIETVRCNNNALFFELVNFGMYVNEKIFYEVLQKKDGDEEIFNFLIKKNLINKYNKIPDEILYKMVSEGNEKMFDRIVSLGHDITDFCNPSNKDRGRWNLLFALVRPSASYSFLQTGLQFGGFTTRGKLESYSNDYELITRKITQSHLNIARKLLEFGIEINKLHEEKTVNSFYSSTSTCTILNLAVIQYNELHDDRLVKLLLEHGADHRQIVSNGDKKFFACLGNGKSTKKGFNEKDALLEFEQRYERELKRGEELRQNKSEGRNCIIF